jgi:hypothetical protein
MATIEEIRRLFENAGVPIGSATESPEARLNRILTEVNSGQRSLDAVNTSIQGIAQREGWQPNPYLNQIQQMQQQLATIQGQPVQTGGFDDIFAAQNRMYDRQLADLQSQIAASLGDLSTDRTRSVQDQERAREQAGRSLQARMADQGILRSGINVGAQGRLNEDHLRNLDTITQLYNRGVRNAELQRTSGINQITSGREMSQAEAARRAAQEALAAQQQRAGTVSGLQSSIANLQQLGAPTRAGTNNTANDTMSRIKSMFQSAGVPIAAGGESEQQRLSRIANEISSGRTWESVGTSIGGIAQRMGLTPQPYGGYRPYGT